MIIQLKLSQLKNPLMHSLTGFIAFIVFQMSFTSSQTDSSIALLGAQEHQRLPPLELFKFTGKPIDWPKFIERCRDQIHNKTTLTDSDRMAYLFQNLDGEAKKAVESLDVTGHS